MSHNLDFEHITCIFTFRSSSTLRCVLCQKDNFGKQRSIMVGHDTLSGETLPENQTPLEITQNDLHVCSYSD